jgi:hypothetical protein
MPKALEEQLKRNVNQKHPEWSKERKDAYVYGTLRRTGWRPSTQKKTKKSASVHRRKKSSRSRKYTR